MSAEALKLTSIDEVKQHLAQYNITRAVIVDDMALRTLRQDIWIQLREWLAEDDQVTSDQLAELCEERGVTFDETLPPEDIHTAVFELVAQSASGRSRLRIENPCFGESSLDHLWSHLKAFGLEVDFYESPNDAPHDDCLYFVDFDINDSVDTAGLRAQQFLKGLMDNRRAKGKCPAVVLMSKDRRDATDVSTLADAAHVVRFCFCFHDKQSLTYSESQCAEQLIELFDAYAVGLKYVSHVDAVRASLASAADKAASEMLRLTPTDFFIFAEKKLGGSGVDSLRHLHFLFSGLLEANIRETQAVQQSLTEFANTLASARLGTMSYDGFALHQIHGNILYDRSQFIKSRSLTFGDILSVGDEVSCHYLLIITPECDLEIRGDGQAKADRVLMVQGAVVGEPKRAVDFLEYTPLLAARKGSSPQWIEWNLRQPHTQRLNDLNDALSTSGGTISRWGRMRHEFAEKIQQRFASDILEVGTEETLFGFGTRSVDVFDDISKVGVLTLCELWTGADKNDSQLALGADSSSLAIAIANRGIEPRRLRSFRSFVPRKKFCGDFKNLKVFFVQKGDQIGAVVRDSITDWKAPDEWADYKVLS